MIWYLTKLFHKVVPWFWVIFCVLTGISNFIQWNKEKSFVSWGSFGYFIFMLIILMIFKRNWKILVARSKAKHNIK